MSLDIMRMWHGVVKKRLTVCVIIVIFMAMITQTQIAAKLECSTGLVQKILKRENIMPVSIGKRGMFYYDDSALEIVRAVVCK
jgi:hypothetical protein